MDNENLDLALIVVFEGSKSAFENKITDYIGKLVLVTGKSDAAAIADKESYIYAIEDAENYKSIKIPTQYVSSIKHGDTVFRGSISIGGSNGISIVDTDSGIEIKGEGLTSTVNQHTGLINTVTNTANQAKEDASSALTKIGTLVGSVIGDDGKSARTIAEEEAAAAMNALDEALKGNSGDNLNSETIAGAKKYADQVKTDLMGNANTDNSILGIREDLSNAISGAAITITASNGNYEVKQGGNIIGTITIPKDMVVESGSIVLGDWTNNNNTFTENENGTGKALKLTIKNQDAPIYINVADLVDVYTAQAKAAQVQIAISKQNEISASIVAGSISTTELNNLAVTNAKIANSTIEKEKLASGVQTSLGKADSAYQKPDEGVPESDLSQGVQTKLNRTVNIGEGDYIEVKEVTEGNKLTNEISAKTKTIDQAKKDSLLGVTNQDALATADDVYAFIKARLSIKIVSPQ